MKNIKRIWIALASISGGVVTIITALNAFGDVPPPVLSIQSLGTNQFSITINNAVATTNYTLFWTPVLADGSYPWQVLRAGIVGQSNFIVDGGDSQVGFFRMLIGADSDADGIPDWMDAAPLDPSIGILSLTINAPLNGAVVQ